MTQVEFIKHVRRFCKENDVKFSLSKTRPKIYNSQIDGVFTGDMLYVYKSDNYIFVLVHELAHMLQSQMNTRKWKSVSAKEFTDFESGSCNSELIKKIQQLELEAEHIAICIIKILNLPVCIDDYIIRANILLYSYSYTKLTSIPCMLIPKEIDYKVPTKLLRTYDKIPTRLKERFNELCNRK